MKRNKYGRNAENPAEKRITITGGIYDYTDKITKKGRGEKKSNQTIATTTKAYSYT